MSPRMSPDRARRRIIPACCAGVAALVTIASLHQSLTIGRVGPARLHARVSAVAGTLVVTAPPLAPAMSQAAPAPASAVPGSTGPAAAAVIRPVAHEITGVHLPLLRRNRLTSADGTLDTGVSRYSDCTGRSPLTRESAAIDTCISGPLYFVGHNVGVFTPLMHMNEGALITYFDADAVAHVWRVISVRPGWRAADGPAPPTGDDVVAQFQTCATADGSIDRILDVTSA